LGKSVKLWFVISVIGLFVLACFYTLKGAADLFLPLVLASFLGFLLTPVTRWLKKIGLPNFWAPLLGTLSFLIILIALCAALCTSLVRFEPEVPQYVDHVQARLAPIRQAVHNSSPVIRLLGDWLNPENIPKVSISGPSFVEQILKRASNYLALLVVVHVLTFFFLLYGARLQKKLVEMIPGLPEKQNAVGIASEIVQTASRYFTSITD
jgi:predicted PurR-regulated permease PerM